jgi:hypothetical protein
MLISVIAKTELNGTVSKRKAGKIVLIEWIGESASLLHTRIRSHQPGIKRDCFEKEGR